MNIPYPEQQRLRECESKLKNELVSMAQRQGERSPEELREMERIRDQIQQVRMKLGYDRSESGRLYVQREYTVPQRPFSSGTEFPPQKDAALRQ